MSSEEKLLIKFIGLFAFTTSIAQIFLNVYLFNLGGLRIVVEYNLISLIFLFICYVLSGYLLKNYSQIVLVRIGVLFLALSYFLLFILKDNSIRYILFLGMINGIGNGNFWSGFNLSQYIATHTDSRHEYFGKQNFFISASNTIGPLLGGGTIFFFSLFATKNWGYSFLFLIVSVLFFYLFITIRKSSKHTGVDFSIRHVLEHNRTAGWKIVLSQQFLYGLFDNTFVTFSGILFFLILKDELSLGFVNTISAFIYAVSSLFAINLLKKYHYSYLGGALISSLGLLFFGLQQNIFGIISILILFSFPLSFLNITTAKTYLDVIDRSKDSWEDKYHFLVERDSAIGAGRILSYVILLFFLNKVNDPQIAKNWMLVIPIFPLIIGGLQYLYYKKTATN